MKKLLILIFAAGFWCCESNQQKSVENSNSDAFTVSFVQTSFAEAQQQAKNANKMLLLDFYAVW